MKPKWTPHGGKWKQKSSSSKKVNLADDNLEEFFGSSQEKNNQETADVAPNELQKKPKSEPKDEPKSSNCEDVHKSPQGLGGEGLTKPPSKLKGSPQQEEKSESEDSSSSSSLSSDSQSSDEERVNHRGR